MRILILGSGGREHTFAWKLNQSELCDHLFIAPGNAGTAMLGTNLPIDPMNFEDVKAKVLEEQIDMVIVGPEAPLVKGITNFFASDPALKQVHIIGPNQAAAQLEGSKDFAKIFMQEYQIPTAAYRSFDKRHKAEGLAYLEQHALPIVLKADGLAAGKGVLICTDREHAKKEFTAMLDGKFGEASNTIVVEEFLEGIEFSVFILTDGENYVLLPEAKDYKRIGEQDTGLNTGGMGAVSPVPFVTEEVMEKVTQLIIQPTLDGLRAREIRYQGFIFFGIILVKNQPFVIEYNCRMGDPETEVVFPRINNDLVALLKASSEQTLNEIKMEVSEQSAATVIMVSGGYPEAYEKGKKIDGIGEVTSSVVFHAGTKNKESEIVTNGGRVLAITSLGEDFHYALETSYQNIVKIDFEGKYFRKDIGFDL